MIEWSVYRVVARAARPGYPGRAVSRIEIESWVREARSLGICTVICLLSDSELGIYAAALAIVGGLLGFYRSRGLAVHHIPVEDAQEPPLTDEQLGHVLDVFQAADKPVLVHASAEDARTDVVIGELRSLLGGW